MIPPFLVSVPDNLMMPEFGPGTVGVYKMLSAVSWQPFGLGFIPQLDVLSDVAVEGDPPTGLLPPRSGKEYWSYPEKGFQGLRAGDTYAIAEAPDQLDPEQTKAEARWGRFRTDLDQSLTARKRQVVTAAFSRYVRAPNGSAPPLVSVPNSVKQSMTIFRVSESGDPPEVAWVVRELASAAATKSVAEHWVVNAKRWQPGFIYKVTSSTQALDTLMEKLPAEVSGGYYYHVHTFT
jgi:hypothetical protein